MAAHVRTVEIPEADRRKLKRRARSKGAPARVVERARIVLLAGDGVPGKQIAARADQSRRCQTAAARLRIPGIELLSASPACCDGPAAVSSHHPRFGSVSWRSMSATHS
jgi:hypothetical protein